MKKLLLRFSLLCTMCLFALGVSAEDEPDYLCFTANEANSTVTLNKAGDPNAVTLQTSTDGSTWNNYTIGNAITLSSIGSKVYFRNEASNGLSKDVNNYYYFSMTGSIAAGGNIMSLVNQATEIPCVFCFAQLFLGCTSLTTAPELPATTLRNGCYYAMFQGCSSLNFVKVAFTEWGGTIFGKPLSHATMNLLKGVSSTGTFICPSALNTITRGDNSLPEGWTVVNPSVTEITTPGSAYVNESTTFTTDAQYVDKVTYYVRKNEGSYDAALEGDTFTPDEAGTYYVKAEATDITFTAAKVLTEKSFTVKPLPEITELIPASGYLGNSFTFRVESTYEGETTFSYYVKNSADGKYDETPLESNSFTPQAAGTYYVKVVATSESEPNTENEFTFTVKDVPVITELTVTPESCGIGSTISFAATPNNFVGKPTITYYVKKSTDEEYPEDPINGNTFTPTEPGTYNVRVLAECDPEPYADKEETFVVLPQFDLTVSELGWASLYFGRDLVIPASIMVYYVDEEISGDEFALKCLEGQIPANTGVIVKAEQGQYVFPFAEGTVPALDGNLFNGLLEDKLCSEVSSEEGNKTIYVLAGKDADGVLLFQPFNTTSTLAAYKVYLPLEGSQQNIKFRIADEGDATSINSFRSTNADSKAVNLMGVPVSDNYKGIILKGGKKFMIR